jgi:hypothetical protein
MPNVRVGIAMAGRLLLVPEHANERPDRMKAVHQKLRKASRVFCLLTQLIASVRQIAAIAMFAQITMANMIMADAALGTMIVNRADVKVL